MDTVVNGDINGHDQDHLKSSKKKNKKEKKQKERNTNISLTSTARSSKHRMQVYKGRHTL